MREVIDKNFPLGRYDMSEPPLRCVVPGCKGTKPYAPRAGGQCICDKHWRTLSPETRAERAKANRMYWEITKEAIRRDNQWHRERKRLEREAWRAEKATWAKCVREAKEARG